MRCPKCKSENEENATVCSNCGFKLKLKCPYCGTYNPIGAKTCSNCSKQLLKLCPECKTVNFSTAKVCRKCSTPFSHKPEVVKTQESIPEQLEKASSLAVELINISSIKTNVKSEEMSTKIINKFYQIFAKAAKSAGMKALKLSENVLAVSFAHAPSFPDSVNMAIEFAGALANAFDEVSNLLESKLKISYKTRYLVSRFRPTQKKDIISALSLGVVDDVIFDEEVYSILKDKLSFNEIETPEGVKFYKFINQDSPETMSADTPREPLQKTRIAIVNEMIKKVEMSQEGFVACLNGPAGIGKSHIFNILRYTFEEDHSHIWLLGQCSLQSPNVPLAFFKSVLQNLFDIPAFNIDLETTKKKVYTHLTDKLGISDETLVNDIFAVLFFDESRLQKNIYENKKITYRAISAIFRALLTGGAVVLQIEDIENIDKFSMDILRSLFEDGIMKCNFKLFITSDFEDNNIINFFSSSHITQENTFFAQYPPMTKSEIDDSVIKMLRVREELGANILNHIYDNSNGMPVFVEEFISLLLQLGIVQFTADENNPITVSPDISKLTFPKTVQEIIQLRLTNISNINPDAFKALYFASILGFKFLPAVVQNILGVDENTFTEIMKYLSMNNLIVPFDTFNYCFKNRIIWETVRNLQLSPDNKVTSVTSSMKTLVNLTMPDMANVIYNLLGISVAKQDILNYIEHATKEAYTVGDDYSYVYHKILLIEAVEASNLENKQNIIISLKTELVNMSYTSFPDIAIKYADDLFTYYEPLDTAKTIDVLGIMSVSFEATGNYLAAIECADKALEKIDGKVNQLAAMLLKYSKLSSIMSLGRYEELINIARNEILPVIKLYFDMKLKEETSLRENDITSILLETKYKCAMAMALQGSAAAHDAAAELYNEANNEQNSDYMLKAQFVKGVINIIQGNMQETDTILNSTKDLVAGTKEATQNSFMWLLIKDIAAFFRGEYSAINNELFMLANFAQNIKKHFIVPVLKGIAAKIALSEGNVDYAQNIAYEGAYICSNNKWGLGVLINWLVCCEIAMVSQKYEDALKIAQNALDAAERANINNLFFTSLLKMKLAEIYLLRSDYDMAKINAAEAYQLADINDYAYIKASLGVVYFDILIKQAEINPSAKNDNIKLLHKQLVMAQDAVLKINNENLSMQIKQNLEAIEDFAEKNSIKLG